VATEALAELLREGWQALAAADWERARERFEQAREQDETPEALDGLSEAVHFQGEYDLAIELKEQAFAAYRDAADPVRAADVARWLAFLHGTFHGNFAVASGWIARAESLLEGVEECAAHGWLMLDRAPLSGDPTEREKFAASALAIARRFGDADLEFDALALLGETYVATGRVAEGMRLLDHAMAAVAAREVAAHGAIGAIYCRMLSACEYATDLRRAEEWMSVVDRYAAWTRFVRPTCRTHYGAILTARGQWSQAEIELLDAVQTFERGYRGDRVYPLVRLADLRVRQGRYEEAERLLEGAEWHPLARRAAAEIALARGDLSLARDLAALCLEGAGAADRSSAAVLELLVCIHLAGPDVAAARETLARLEALAEASGSEWAGALGAFAAGSVLEAEGDDDAVARLKQALEGFAALDLPLEAGRAQLALAKALAPRAPDAAAAEARLALATFERLGAAPLANAAAGLLRELGVADGRMRPRNAGALTRREQEVLELLGAGLPNAEIAERLVISRRTAEHHVANVLSKLGLRSRAEAAAYAVREGPKDR
jgi:DNA-binding NarL/FixJ family response regulator